MEKPNGKNGCSHSNDQTGAECRHLGGLHPHGHLVYHGTHDKVSPCGGDRCGMVKQLKQWYNYNGKAYTLPELQKFVRFDGARNIFGSLCVTTKNEMPGKSYSCVIVIRKSNAFIC